MKISNYTFGDRVYKNINVSVTHTILDNEQIKKIYKSITTLKKTALEYKTTKDRDTLEYAIIRDNIRDLRFSLNNEYAISVFNVEIKLGKNVINKYFNFYPNHECFKDIINDFLYELSMKRKNKNALQLTNKEWRGYKYKTLAGVFTEKNSILGLMTRENMLRRIDKAKKPEIYDKNNYIGIELEVISPVNKSEIIDAFIDAKLAGYVYLKDDSSIKPESDNETACEVTVLAKESEYTNIVNRVCKVLNDLECYVNGSCGMHVHFDARMRDGKRMYNNLVKFLPLLSKMVPLSRRESSHGKRYCALNTSANMDQSSHPYGEDRRYQAVNPVSFNRYKTIEVRLHGGTINAVKINNWIKVCLYAVNCAYYLDNPINDLMELSQQYPVDSKLFYFIEKRIELFKSKQYDTRTDHYFLIESEAC